MSHKRIRQGGELGSMLKSFKGPPSFKNHRFSSTHLLTFALVFAAIGGYALLRSQATSGTTANIWVDTSGGLCSRNGTKAVYDSIVACGSLSSAFATAQTGDVVAIKTGEYDISKTSISYNSALTDYVSFIPDGQVIFKGKVCLGNDTSSDCDGKARSSPDWVRFDSDSPTGDFVYAGSIRMVYKNRTPSNIQILGGHSKASSSFRSGNNVLLKNLDIGPSCCTADGLLITSSGAGVMPAPTNYILDGIHIHDIARRCAAYPGQNSVGIGPATCPGDDGSAHVDCLQMNSGHNITIKNSRFYNCATQGVFLGGGAGNFPIDTTCGNSSGCYWGELKFQNNMIGARYESATGLGIGRGVDTQDPSFGPGTRVLIENNSVVGGLSSIGSIKPPTFVEWNNNIGTWQPWVVCQQQSGVTYTWKNNAMVGKTCGTTDILLTSTSNLWKSTAVLNTDLHLKSAANEVVDRGDTSSCVRPDIDGDLMNGTGCDIGADEFNSSSAPAPSPLPSPTPTPTPTPTPPPTPTPAPPATTPKRGDLNSDAQVTIVDLSILLTRYGTTNTTGDIDINGRVDVVDLSILLSNYGK